MMKLISFLKKRSVKITLIISLGVVLVAGILVFLWHTYLESLKDHHADDRDLLLSLPAVSDVNYNNYTGCNGIYGSTMDYQDGRFAWLSGTGSVNMLTVVDEDGSRQQFRGVQAPFQLCGDYVVYLYNGDYLNDIYFLGNLRILDTNTGKVMTVEEEVQTFIVYENSIIFEIEGSTEQLGVYDRSLLIYDIETKKTKKLLDNPERWYKYYVYRDQLYVYFYDDTLVKIDLRGDLTPSEPVEVPDLSSGVMQSGKCLLYRTEGDLCVFDTETEKKTVLTLGKGDWSVDLITAIADDENIYLSVQRRKEAGSIEYDDIEHEDNGLWRVDPETLEAKKVLPDVFWELYLADGLLLGRKEEQIYRIDTKTFEIKALLG